VFSPGTRALFEQLPSLPNLHADEARRLLSTMYLEVLVRRGEFERKTDIDGLQVRNYLRRLTNALESYSIFDDATSEELRRGSAFVAAESLSLFVQAVREENTANTHSISDPICYATIEAALLFLVAGFDANAATLVGQLHVITPTSDATPQQNHESWLLNVLVCLTKLDRSALPEAPPLPDDSIPMSMRASIALTRKFGSAVADFLAWLCIEDDQGFDSALRSLNDISDLLAREKAWQHAPIYHLSRIVAVCIRSLSPRALRNAPRVESNYYQTYVRNRSRGSGRLKARPLLWESTFSYSKSCLPGPRSSAVVRLPTGAGKSFVAELAAVQAIEEGWVLYLVPTNALAAQVRTDLEKSFESIGDVEIRAFLGGEEYTSLPEEKVGELSNRTVAVMTPEKCALALRLAPNVFQNCRLCIFDECHLIGEEHRGALAELVLSHIIAASPNCRFLLMSAMLANADDLASWLRSVTQADVIIIDEDWRPTRAIRAVVGLDLEGTRSNVRAAIDRLKSLPAHRKREKFSGIHCFVANLQGTWQSNETVDHAIFLLPTETVLQVDRTPTIESGGWVNSTASAITKHFADKNERVLTFLPASKHYPFSVGEKMDVVNHRDAMADPEISGLIDIAEDELGVESGVRILMIKGIAVHTAALLEAEKLTSEIAFSREFVPVMLATGTLAQGLNLPASVVIIGGTTIGDRREANSADAQQRARAQLLNALGRAGRAGFGSHGLGLVVPNQPIYVATPPILQKHVRRPPLSRRKRTLQLCTAD
jgi:hypothetical protein